MVWCGVMLAKRLWWGVLCLAACSFETADTAPADSSPAAETSGGEGDTTTAPTGNPMSTGPGGETSSPSTATTGGETSPTVGETTDETTGDTTGETGDVNVEPGCPQPLPDSWVLCEDFEDVGDFSNHFAAVYGSGLAIGGPGYESTEALELTHFAQQSWSGELWIRFGEGPASANTAEPDTQFDEVWTRFRFRADEGWPVQGPGDLLSIDGVAENGGWGATFKARVSAGQAESSIRNGAFTCLFGGSHPCMGANDWDHLSYLGGELGEVPVFAESVAEQWHCAVLHARLNTAGNSNGLLEVAVDGQSDASLPGLDFRGSRSDLGFNMLSIAAFLEAPLQDDHRRYIDDVVVSTEALDCD